ncbi:type IV secretory system conjugative DNA transfer family protein, partial [Anaerovibrio slackiae]
NMNFDNFSTKEPRLLLILDEFQEIKKLDSIVKVMSICPEYGVKICIVVQTIRQLTEIYTEDEANKILANSQVQIYMTPSEYNTAESLSHSLGKTIITIPGHRIPIQDPIQERFISILEKIKNIMTPDEIIRMDMDKNQLVLAQGGKPILAKKIKWYEDPYFTKIGGENYGKFK